MASVRAGVASTRAPWAPDARSPWPPWVPRAAPATAGPPGTRLRARLASLARAMALSFSAAAAVACPEAAADATASSMQSRSVSGGGVSAERPRRPRAQRVPRRSPRPRAARPPGRCGAPAGRASRSAHSRRSRMKPARLSCARLAAARTFGGSRIFGEALCQIQHHKQHSSNELPVLIHSHMRTASAAPHKAPHSKRRLLLVLLLVMITPSSACARLQPLLHRRLFLRSTAAAVATAIVPSAFGNDGMIGKRSPAASLLGHG